MFWNDEDISLFEMKLSDVMRKFNNLEALQKDLFSPSEDYEVRRITLTKSDGNELNKVIWINKESRKEIDEITGEVLRRVDGNKELQQALIASLAERLLK